MFNAPIPGQSLTSEPGNASWERPPQFAAPEDALFWHMERLQEPERIDAMVNLLEEGLDVVSMTEGILRAAVAEGRHSIDVSLIIAPVIHEYITGTADAVGIEYDEGLEDEDKLDESTLQYAANLKAAEKVLGDIQAGKQPDLEELEEAAPQQEEMEEPVAEKPKGLMARETM